MRLAPATAALAAALAAAACSVDVEGAPCSVPGSREECPSGQACGTGLTCSERAASCQPCTVGDVGCSGGDVKVCTAAGDDACGAWTLDGGGVECRAQGLECGTRSGAPDCECPAFAGPELAVDPVAGSTAAAFPYASGAATPPQCRFASLAAAIARAGQVASATAPATVRAYGAGAQLVFDEAPIAIPAHVTVSASPDATVTVLRPASSTDSALVTLSGALDGFRVEAAGATGPGVATACAPGAAPTLDGVTVNGGGTLTAGIDVSGACGADVAGVDVSNVAGPALLVRADPAATVTVSSGTFRASGVGARVTGGDVTFGADGVPVGTATFADNAAEGLVVTGAAVSATTVRRAAVHGNGGTGVVLEMVNPAAQVELRGCDVYRNGSAGARAYGPEASRRTAGGVFVAQGSLPLAFQGNRVFANAGDQLAFESSGTGWSIAPPACGPSSNLFHCVAAGVWAVAVAGGGQVDARNTVWPAVPFAAYASVGVTGSYCNGAAGVPATPTCPVP